MHIISLCVLEARLNPVPLVKDARESEGGTVDRSNEFEFPVSRDTENSHWLNSLIDMQYQLRK